MKETIYTLLNNSQNDLSWQQILANVLVAALLGMLIYISYFISHRGTIYSKKFNASLVVLTVLTGTVMTVIGNNIALSLGTVSYTHLDVYKRQVRFVNDD